MHPDIFSLMHPDFFSLMHPNNLLLFLKCYERLGILVQWRKSFFPPLCTLAPSSLDLGSLLHLSHLLLLGMVRTSGHLLQVRKSDLYEVTSVMLSMLGRSIFLKSLARPFGCCFETSSSSTFDAML